MLILHFWKEKTWKNFIEPRSVVVEYGVHFLGIKKERLWAPQFLRKFLQFRFSFLGYSSTKMKFI